MPAEVVAIEPVTGRVTTRFDTPQGKCVAATTARHPLCRCPEETIMDD